MSNASEHHAPQDGQPHESADELFDAAEKWLQRGYNVVPQNLQGGKFPSVKWKDLKTRRVELSDLQCWRDRRRFSRGVGFITGAISDAVVIDTDGEEGEALLREFEQQHGALPKTLTIRSGSGRGLHRHFKHPGERVTTRANVEIKIDVKGDGGFCVLPPILHKSGGRYEVLVDAELAPLPEGLLGFIEERARAAKGKKKKQRYAAKTAKAQGVTARVAAGSSALPEADADLAHNATGRDAEALIAALQDARLRTVCGFLIAAGVFAREHVTRTQWLALPRMLMKLGVDETTVWSIWARVYDGDNWGVDTGEAAVWVSENGYGLPEFTQIMEAAAQKAGRDDVLSALDVLRHQAREAGSGVKLEDFYAYMPGHSYIFAPTGEMWPAASINGRFGKDINEMLDKCRPVEQMTWAPGEPRLISDRLVLDGGWLERKGTKCFNLYRPPVPRTGGIAVEAKPWLDHIHRIYPCEAEHIMNFLAHRVQRPGEKINHALVLGGNQGIGKDTLLEPVKRAVGPWNFQEISPEQLMGRFNGFAKSVILRVNEARDLGEANRFQFYERLKAYEAAPPDVLRVDEKNLREHYVQNCCGVIITTNHKADGIYLPADDRRHYVAWSDCRKEDFSPEYWRALWAWYEAGGYAQRFLESGTSLHSTRKRPLLKPRRGGILRRRTEHRKRVSLLTSLTPWATRKP